MNLRFTPAMLEDPDTLVTANMLLVNAGIIVKDGDKTVYKLPESREKLIDKVKLEKLVKIGTEIYGDLHLYAEVDDVILEQPVPDTFPGSKIKDEKGDDAGTRKWKDQSIITKGTKGTSLILFVNLTNGKCGNPKGMSFEDFKLYRKEFPDYKTSSEKDIWVKENGKKDILIEDKKELI